MPPLSFPSLRLACHAATPCSLPIELSCSIWTDTRPSPALHLRYELVGDLSGLRLPSPAPEGAADGLWQHTCFEAFVMPAQGPAYHEFNFSPSGQWAHYRFSAERVRCAADLKRAADSHARRPLMQLEQHASRLVLQASLDQESLPIVPSGDCLRLGLSAVVEDHAGQLSYWALHHPAARPDFHHPGGFAHALPWPPLP